MAKDIEKQQLVSRLRQLGGAWSYAPDAPLPDNVLIEEVLRWGDVDELEALFKLFDRATIRNIWREKLIPDERVYRHNYYLALIFFNIKNPKRYMTPLQKKYSRYEKLKQLAT